MVIEWVAAASSRKFPVYSCRLTLSSYAVLVIAKQGRGLLSLTDTFQNRKSILKCVHVPVVKAHKPPLSVLNIDVMPSLLCPNRWAEYCDERVCLCFSVSDHIFGTARTIFTNCLHMLPMAMARSSGGTVISYVFPVLWMTSCLHISWSCSMSPPGWGWHAALGFDINGVYEYPL